MTYKQNVRARYLVTQSTRYYHGSPHDHGEQLHVKPYGHHIGFDFGGVFLSSSKLGHMGSSGNFWYEIELADSDILQLSDIYYSFESDPRVLKVLDQFGLNKLDEDQKETAWELLCARYHDEKDERRIFGEEDSGWTLQAVQGQIARALGYKAVELEDERGGVYLLLGPAIMQRERV